MSTAKAWVETEEREHRFAELERAIELMSNEERAAYEAERDAWLSADLS